MATNIFKASVSYVNWEGTSAPDSESNNTLCHNCPLKFYNLS
jgi:hypothetical protein